MRLTLYYVSFLFFVSLTQTVLINIGHVYRSDSEIPVISMAYQDLQTQGILPNFYDFQ
jgi:hypothetical protein